MTDASMEILMLPVPLTESEKNTRAREMAQLMTELERAELAEAVRKKMAAEALKTLEAKVRDLRVVVHSGLEDRPVECDVIFEFNSGTVKHVRRDTGETASSRAMTEKEKESARQASLWGPNAPTIKVSSADSAPARAWWTPREAGAARDAYDELLGQAHREESDEAAPVWWPATLKGLWRLPDPDAREFGVGDLVAVVEELGGGDSSADSLAERLDYRPAEVRVMLALLRNAGMAGMGVINGTVTWALETPDVDEVQARRLADSAVASACTRAKGLANWPDAIAASGWLLGSSSEGLQVEPNDMHVLWHGLWTRAGGGEHPWFHRATDAWTPTEAVAVAMILEKHGLLEHVGNLEFRALEPLKSSPPKAGRKDSLPPASKPAKPKTGPKPSTVKAVDKALDGGP